MDLPRRADRYISRGGRPPAYDRASWTDDLIAITSFMVWAEADGASYGGETAKDAYSALCRLIDIDGVKLRTITLGGV